MDNSEHELEMTDVAARIEPTKLARYAEIRQEAHVLYNSFTPIRCSALGNKYIHFPAEGFNHLVYRIAKQERDRRVQIMRFELLPKARQLLEKTTTIQEYEEYFDEVSKWMHKKKVRVPAKIHDIGFIGIISGFRIKVVVRRIGNGNFEFLSVIPAWSTKYYRDIKIVRQTKGNVAD